jgi:hydroxymethylglutaryl-CoA reductase
MALHARSVAVAAGASTDEVERIALMIVEARDITVDGAARALGVLRAEATKGLET